MRLTAVRASLESLFQQKRPTFAGRRRVIEPFVLPETFTIKQNKKRGNLISSLPRLIDPGFRRCCQVGLSILS